MPRILNALYRRARWMVLGDRMVNLWGRGVIDLIDVGSIGALPRPWNENASRISHLVKFEPRDEGAPARPHITTCNTVLWSEECERDFYVYRGGGGTGSSLYRQNFDYVRENFEQLRRHGPQRLAESWFDRSQLERVERLRCRRLDDVLANLERELRSPFLKIDAQGAEYEILRGAEDLLEGDCAGLHLELFTVPLYEGITLLPRVVDYLAGFGFELALQYPAHGSFHSQHDCVFLRSGSTTADAAVIRKIYGL